MNPNSLIPSDSAVVIGAGPAGLMAAQALAQAGVAVHVFDAMPSVGRKFLLAGKGGLNLTHSEPMAPFVSRYGARQAQLAPLLAAFGAEQVCAWARDLGVETFVGTSGRVFPADMKAAPLLRAWLQRLRSHGVQFHMRHRFTGWDSAGALQFQSPTGDITVQARAVVLALGGGSWARLGSDGAWLAWLAARGIATAPLQPSNCGFDVGWSAHFAQRFAGQPLKTVALAFTDSAGQHFSRRGEFVATQTGVEGSLIYAVSALLRDEISAHGHATFTLDLLPDHSPERVLKEVRHPRGTRSLSSHLKSRLGLDGVKMGLLYEQLGKDGVADAPRLAAAIKALPITAVAARPIDEAISTGGGVAFEALDAQLMAQALPGVFCAGEMLDWEAPTGGYLLTACLSTGHAAGRGALAWLNRPDSRAKLGP